MKKATKLLCLILIVVTFATIATGGSPSFINSVTDNRAQSTTASYTTDDFETIGYLYENTIGDTLYFVTVKNNSDSVVSVEGNATARDSNGRAIGAGNMSVDVLGPGETSIGYFYFDRVSGIDTVDYQLNYSKENYYKPVIANLNVNQTLNAQNVTVTVTNAGNINAQFVEAYALFFDAEDNLISYSSSYITDNDCEIKPGAALSAQLGIYGKEYDHVSVYFTGRSDGSHTDTSSMLTESDFSLVEYKYENSIGDTLWFLVVTNNSEYDVGITANSTAYDQAGNAIGAADASIDVLGSGQTSICYFYFDSVKDIDYIQYQLFYQTDLYYDDVIHSLLVDTTINNNNVIVAVKNNGTVTAEFVEAYALFFDEQGKLVGYDSTYVTDNDSEIKSGATITRQLNIYSAFSTVEVYFTGRHSHW